MEKAIFFSGCGTSFSAKTDKNNSVHDYFELYPETLPALRFLARRGYLPVLVTPEIQEYKVFSSSLKDKTIELQYWNGNEKDLDVFIRKHRINLPDCHFITDGKHLREALLCGMQTILVLTGKGVSTLDRLETRQLEKVCDVCKDIYAAVISIVIRK